MKRERKCFMFWLSVKQTKRGIILDQLSSGSSCFVSLSLTQTIENVERTVRMEMNLSLSPFHGKKDRRENDSFTGIDSISFFLFFNLISKRRKSNLWIKVSHRFREREREKKEVGNRERVCVFKIKLQIH